MYLLILLKRRAQYLPLQFAIGGLSRNALVSSDVAREG